MHAQCNYPQYAINLPDDIIRQAIDLAPKLLNEVGMLIDNHRFLSYFVNTKGLEIKGSRIHFEKKFVRKYIDSFITEKNDILRNSSNPLSKDWEVTTDGFSMTTIDVETEELRSATCQDLRDMIKLANSLGIGGSYMVMPQDVPPLLQAIQCFKICFEMSDNVRPYDYQQPEQLPFIYEMHQIVERPMDLVITIPSTMCIDPKDIDIFLKWYPVWKRERNIKFQILDYPMIGITKPLSVPGCAAMCFAETLATHMLFNIFDPEINLPISLHGGLPTDMMHACWAFGSPRSHLFRYLNAMVLPNLCSMRPETYSINDSVNLETSSPTIDEQAAMEKMGCAMVAAMQGARHFSYAGTLCVDDVYSGTQFVIDLEIVEYIKETINAFNAHTDIVNIQDLYEECRDVAIGADTFVSSMNTATRFRNIIPSSQLLVREKLRSWMCHRKTIKDRARETALEHIRTCIPFRLAEDKQRQLEIILQKAKTQLG
jgi:trimethylamine:corrinoid methyltransferase-like protein